MAFQYLREGHKKDREKFFTQTNNNRTRGGGGRFETAASEVATDRCTLCMCIYIFIYLCICNYSEHISESIPNIKVFDSEQLLPT